MPRSFGRFSILGELGRGGFGVVYLAEDPLLKHRVTLKLPRIEILSGTESWRRFLREAQATSRLDHPKVIPLLEAGTMGPFSYLISGYVAWPSLEHWLPYTRRAVSPRTGAQIVAALAHAMEHAHRRGILPRDLKPANMMLSAPEREGEASNTRVWKQATVALWQARRRRVEYARVGTGRRRVVAAPKLETSTAETPARDIGTCAEGSVGACLLA